MEETFRLSVFCGLFIFALFYFKFWTKRADRMGDKFWKQDMNSEFIRAAITAVLFIVVMGAAILIFD
jgi:hypothetical protein